MESELFAYPDTKREIDYIRAEILHPFEENPDDPTIVKGKNSVRVPGDPTGMTATLLVTNRKLEQMERVVNVIDTILDRLPESKKRMMKLRYWTNPQTLTWDGIALKLGVSRITAIRWRNDIVYLIAEKMGWR